MTRRSEERRWVMNACDDLTSDTLARWLRIDRYRQNEKSSERIDANKSSLIKLTMMSDDEDEANEDIEDEL